MSSPMYPYYDFRFNFGQMMDVIFFFVFVSAKQVERQFRRKTGILRGVRKETGQRDVRELGEHGAVRQRYRITENRHRRLDAEGKPLKRIATYSENVEPIRYGRRGYASNLCDKCEQVELLV